MIRQGCQKKSYSGSLHLTFELTTSHGKNKESLMIVIVTLTYKKYWQIRLIRFLMAFLPDPPDSHPITDGLLLFVNLY
jgi:hypothetical protein